MDRVNILQCTCRDYKQYFYIYFFPEQFIFCSDMYFRLKKSPSGQVLQLLESYRNGEGQPRHRVVVSLGDAAMPENLRNSVAKTIERKLYPTAQGELFSEELSTEAGGWIDQIYNRIVREGRFRPLYGKNNTESQPQASEELINGVWADRITHSHNTTLGPLLLAKHAWDKLKLSEKLEALGFNAAQRAVAAAAVFNPADFTDALLCDVACANS